MLLLASDYLICCHPNFTLLTIRSKEVPFGSNTSHFRVSSPIALSGRVYRVCVAAPPDDDTLSVYIAILGAFCDRCSADSQHAPTSLPGYPETSCSRLSGLLSYAKHAQTAFRELCTTAHDTAQVFAIEFLGHYSAIIAEGAAW